MFLYEVDVVYVANPLPLWTSLSLPCLASLNEVCLIRGEECCDHLERLEVLCRSEDEHEFAGRFKEQTGGQVEVMYLPPF